MDTESSLTVADGASTSAEAGVSTAETLANRVRNSPIPLWNVTLFQGGVLVETVERQIFANCAPGYWCSAALSIPCVHNTYQPEIDQISAGACLQCPEFSVSEEASTSIEQCKCMASYYDSKPAADEVLCELCTAGSSCATVGTTTATLNITAGWYRTASDSADLRRCPDASNKESGCIGGIGDEGPCKPCAASLFPRSPLALLQPLCFLSVCHSAHGLRRTGGSKDRTVGSAMSPMARATMTLALRSVCRVMTAILRRRWRFSASSSR